MSSSSSTWDLGERSSERLKAAREGDRNALEQLVEDQRAELLSIAVNQLDSDLRVKESPSDIVQESMLEGLESFEAFRGTTVADFGGYLKAILRNNLQDARRRHIYAAKRSLRRETRDVSADDQAGSLSDSPSRLLQRRDDKDVIRDRLSELSAAQQKILRLRFWDDLSFEEMAATLGQQTDTTRKAFCRALSALTQAVKNSGRQME